MGMGYRLKQLRKNKGLTLKQLSNIADISISFLSDIENGRSKPSLDRIRTLASCLDTTVSFILEEEGAVYTPYSHIIYNEDCPEGLELRSVLDELKNFSRWSHEDKEELLAYLKAKRIARESRKSDRG